MSENIKFKSNLEINDELKEKYIERINGMLGEGEKLLSLTLTFKEDSDDVDIDYAVQGTKFERIRRITGYLTGTVDRWNNGKRAELKDRVKHVK
jgi:hypothetical protein